MNRPGAEDQSKGRLREPGDSLSRASVNHWIAVRCLDLIGSQGNTLLLVNLYPEPPRVDHVHAAIRTDCYRRRLLESFLWFETRYVIPQAEHIGIGQQTVDTALINRRIPAKRFYERSPTIKELNSVIALVGHVYVAVLIDRHPAGVIELSVCITFLADDLD